MPINCWLEVTSTINYLNFLTHRPPPRKANVTEDETLLSFFWLIGDIDGSQDEIRSDSNRYILWA